MRERIEKLLERSGIESLDETHEGFMCACPLPRHDDSTPSFTINTDTGLWICFGCDASGNLPMLASEILDIPMSEAMKGWIVEDDTWHQLPERGTSEDRVLPETVLSAYQRCPMYMLQRGFTKSFLKQLQIGYDPIEHRVVFPIRDFQGKLVGLTKRATFEGVYPKYKHTEFKKSHHLYLGFHTRRRVEVTSATSYKIVFVVEGHVDALRLWQRLGGLSLYGPRKGLSFMNLEFCGAVAVMGGALSREQSRLIALLGVDHVALAFDHDESGEKYEAKSLDALLDVGIRSVYRLEFPGADPGEIESTKGLSLVTL